MTTTAISPALVPAAFAERSPSTTPAPTENPALKTVFRTPEVRPAPEARVAAGFTRDPATQNIVYQVTQKDSGDIVFQLPNDTALKARAYDQQRERVKAEREAEPPTLQNLKV